MSNADGEIIPLVDDDQGEGIKDFYMEMIEKTQLAFSVPKELIENTPPLTPAELLEEKRQALNKMCKKRD